MTYLMVDFSSHVSQSCERIASMQKTLLKYLKENGFRYMVDPKMECTEDSLFEDTESFYDFIINVGTKADFLQLCAFITEELRAPLRSIHIPYQLLEVNGEGQLEIHHILQVRGLSIDDFVKDIWGKKADFPKIDTDPQ